MPEKRDSDRLTVRVKLTDTWQFSRMAKVIGHVLADRRIPREVRDEYYAELNALYNIEAKGEMPVE